MCMVNALHSLEYVVSWNSFLKAVNMLGKHLEAHFNNKSLVLVESAFIHRKQPSKY
jgi:hypothetical protein